MNGVDLSVNGISVLFLAVDSTPYFDHACSAP